MVRCAVPLRPRPPPPVATCTFPLPAPQSRSDFPKVAMDLSPWNPANPNLLRCVATPEPVASALRISPVSAHPAGQPPQHTRWWDLARTGRRGHPPPATRHCSPAFQFFKFQPLAFPPPPSPSGTTENSPAIHRGVGDPKRLQVPPGRQNPSKPSRVPYSRWQPKTNQTMVRLYSIQYLTCCVKNKDTSPDRR